MREPKKRGGGKGVTVRGGVGLSEGKGAIPVDLCLKSFLAHGLFDDIHLAAQNTG